MYLYRNPLLSNTAQHPALHCVRPAQFKFPKYLTFYLSRLHFICHSLPTFPVELVPVVTLFAAQYTINWYHDKLTNYAIYILITNHAIYIVIHI